MTSRSRRRLRALGTILLVSILLLALGAAILRFGSVWRVRQLPNVPNVINVPAKGDPVEGSRLASILGCRGCHGQDLAGRAKCYEKFGEFTLTCPNVTEARDNYDDLALVTLLRHGRKRDGALVDFMPWDMYAQLSDRDLADVVAFIRATPSVHKGPLPESSYSWAIRWDMLRGRYPEQNNLKDYDTKRLDGLAERGRYLASVACPECHAPNLRGYPGDDAPNLVIAKAYSTEAFVRLMREGITLSGKDSLTGLMSSVARNRFAHFRPEEISALKAYLDQRVP